MLPKYKRILLKLSGESLMGDKNFGLDSDVIVTQAVISNIWTGDRKSTRLNSSH